MPSSNGTGRHHAHTANATNNPTNTARGGVDGRQIANANAGANVASAENDNAPTSASAALPAIERLYAHASNMITTMPTRRSISTFPRKSPASPRAHAPRNRPGASQ